MKKWLLFLLITGCKISSFTTIVAPTTSFNSFKTFRIVDFPHQINITQPEYDNPENRTLINQVISEEMTEWGLKKKADTADLIITYTLLIRDMVDTRIDSAVIYKPWLDTQQDSFNYTEGALTIFLMDAASGGIIAQSKLEGIMDRKPKKFNSAIPRLIKMMLKRIEDESKTIN